MSDRMSGRLYIVSTPIGNLEDITLRAIRTLKEVDFVICEDSRRSGLLLKHLNVKKPFRVLHDHTPEPRIRDMVEALTSGQSAALISDAGTPLISDPGYPLLQLCLSSNVPIEAIPGPAAFVQALVLSGLPLHAFGFFGYLPQKDKARRDRLQDLAGENKTMVFYESPYRLEKALKAMREVFGNRRVSVSREMTKKFEETVRGSFDEIISHFSGRSVLGEFCIVIEGRQGDE